MLFCQFLKLEVGVHFLKNKYKNKSNTVAGKLNFAKVKNLDFSYIRGDVLAGMTVALALIPESLAFAAIAKVIKSFDASGTKIYTISGQLFFGSVTSFIEFFNYAGDPEKVTIDFHYAHVWDHAAVTAISQVVARYEKLDKHVVIVGMNQESQSFMNQVGSEEFVK